jgi:hypothetical protein
MRLMNMVVWMSTFASRHVYDGMPFKEGAHGLGATPGPSPVDYAVGFTYILRFIPFLLDILLAQDGVNSPADRHLHSRRRHWALQLDVTPSVNCSPGCNHFTPVRYGVNHDFETSRSCSFIRRSASQVWLIRLNHTPMLAVVLPSLALCSRIKIWGLAAPDAPSFLSSSIS